MSNATNVHLVTIAKHNNNRIAELLKKFQEILQPPRYREQPHDTMHYIKTTGRPVYQRPYRLSRSDREQVEKEFHEMVNVGIVRVSKYHNVSLKFPLTSIVRGV
jgi:hypothetical protein